MAMELWRRVWREGIAPVLCTGGLQAALKALREDDPALLQSATTDPPCLLSGKAWHADGACLAAYCGWKGQGKQTVGELHDYFAYVCAECDRRMGEPAACRFFLNFWDDADREELRRLMIPELELAVSMRETLNPKPEDCYAC